LPPDDVSFPFVVKPSIGFFSIGVHIIKNKEDWLKAKNELQAEKLKSIFPESVLNTNHFIIEEFIPGEEYAIDYYHDQDGKVVILKHLTSSFFFWERHE
jgi:biotin carboxylase